MDTAGELRNADVLDRTGEGTPPIVDTAGELRNADVLDRTDEGTPEVVAPVTDVSDPEEFESAEEEVAPRRSRRLRAQCSNVHSLPRAALQQEVSTKNINSDMLDALCQSHLILMKLAARLNPS